MFKKALILCICSLMAITGYGQSFDFKDPDLFYQDTSSNIFAFPSSSYPVTLALTEDLYWGQYIKYTTAPPTDYTFKSIQNYVSVGVKHSLHKVEAAYSYTAKITIHRYSTTGNPNSPNDNPITVYLPFSYDPDSLKPYVDLNVYKFSGYHAIQAVLDEVRDASGTLVPRDQLAKNFEISSGVYVERYNTHQNVFVSPTCNVNGQYLEVTWGTYSATMQNLCSNNSATNELKPVEFELEWTYVDDYTFNFSNWTSGTNKFSNNGNNIAYNFKKNSTRVRTDSQSYRIPLVYEHGAIVYRLRTVRPDNTTNFKDVKYSAWTLADDGVLDITNSSCFHKQGSLINTPHANDLNWQYTINFAEGGKYKHVINYFDGGLKNRQTQTKINSDASYVIGVDKVYDHEGNLALQTLPTPFVQNYLGYSSVIARNSYTNDPYKAADFDTKSCNAPTSFPSMSTGSLANLYYSGNNSDKAGVQKFVPKANGYPLIQSIYSPSRRLLWQSGVGETHQIWNDHGTRYEYLNVTQGELDKYFGGEAGHYTYFPKQITTDPNGQTSFTITNTNGQPVATGLIGLPSGQTPIEPISTIDNSVQTCVDVLAGFKQNRRGDGLTASTTFYADKTADHSLQYRLKVPVFNYCGKYILAKAEYSFSGTNDCGEAKIQKVTGQLGADNVVNSLTGIPTYYSSPVTTAYSLPKGKYFAYKSITYNKYEVNNRIKSFVTDNEGAGLCFNDQRWFVKSYVEQGNFPCYDSVALSPCESRKREMMKELWPNAKYGQYPKEPNGSIHIDTVVGACPDMTYICCVTNSIFESAYDGYVSCVKNGTTHTFQKSIPRYKSSCLSLPTSVVKDGRTYTNLKDLPIDTFIYIFNDDIANALLPLHPEYCKLSYCDDGTFITQLESFETYKQAEQGNRFDLDDIIQNDPLYVNASSSDKPVMEAKLGHFKNLATKRLDELAIEQAYSAAGNFEEAAHAAKFLFQNEIQNFTFANNTVKQGYYETMRAYYLTNRTYILQRLMDSAGKSCSPCGNLRFNLISPAVFPQIFSPTGNGFDTSVHVPAWMNTLFTNVNGSNLTGLTTPPEIQDSLDAQKASLLQTEIDNIMQDLVSCSISQTTRNAIKAKIQEYAITNGMPLSPNLISGAIAASGVSLSDLCNAFLATHNITDQRTQLENVYDCVNPIIYDGITDFMNRTPVIDAIKGAGYMGSGTYGFHLSSTNKFENKIASYFSIGNTDSVTIEGYLDTIQYTTTQYAKFIKLKITDINNNTLYYYLKRKTNASPYLDGATDLATTQAICLNEDGGISSGYEAKFTVALDMNINGNTSVTDRYYLWSKSITLMADKGNKLPIECITCVAIKDALKTFNSEASAWGYSNAANHPLYETTVTNYLNYKFNKRYNFQDYYNLMVGCAVTDSVEMKRVYATMKVVCPSLTASNTFISNLRSSFTQRDIIATRIKYNTAGNVVIGINLIAVPQDSLLHYKNSITTIASAASCTATYLPVDPTVVFLKSGCTPTNPLSNSGSFSSESGVYYGTNNTSYNGTIFTHTGTLNAIGKATLLQNINVFMQNCNSYAIKDAAEYRSSQQYGVQLTHDYFSYVYAQTGKPVYDIRDSIDAANIGLRISSFAGKKVVYDNAFCSKSLRDIYIYSPNQTGNWGYQLLYNTIFAQVKSYLNTGSSKKVIPTNGAKVTNVSSTLKIFRKANGIYWYRYFDASNNLRNVHLQPPSNPPLDIATLELDSVQVGPGTDSIYRFTAFMHYSAIPSEVVTCKGYTDFPLGFGQSIKNVILHDKPGVDLCMDSIDCEYNLMKDAIYAGKVRYQQVHDSLVTKLTDSMFNYLIDNTKDSLFLCSWNQKGMMTLYYYDLAGNLRKTVPPDGVNESNPNAHTKITAYKYDSRNLVVNQKTPDSYETDFFYDGAGRLVFSQNAKQKNYGSYSYTLYDPLSRITETGEVKLTENATSPHPVYVANVHDDGLYPMDSIIKYVRTLPRTDVVLTTYDTMRTDLGGISGEHLSTQENLLNKVSTIYYYSSKSPDYNNYTDFVPRFATYYSYDILGNVKTATYRCPAMMNAGSQYKRVDYEYDQISGKVNMIAYNRGRGDQFYQQYEYDADNRITKAKTSNDGFVWNTDAKYTYYKHGPLANVKIGENQIQSLDYAYTLQGWLKAINGDVIRYDKSMNPDGAPGNTTYARDAIAFAINYFDGDYAAIDNTAPGFNFAAPAKNLYNGNIARTTASIMGLGNMRGTYKYDQAHRLVEASYDTLKESNLTVYGPLNIFKNTYRYDASGNIDTLVRYNGGGTRIDSIQYNYAAGTNKLQYANDRQGNLTGGVDFKQGQAAYNYKYDSIGNMVEDVRDSLKMQWNLYGKLKQIDKGKNGNQFKIYYDYDGLGNRVRKDVVKQIGADESHIGEYYVRDASGNMLASYKFNSRYSKIKLIEAANDGVRTKPGFTVMVNSVGEHSGTLVKGWSVKAKDVAPAWANAATDKTIGFYLQNNAALYSQLLTGSTADYLNDLQAYDASDPGRQIYANALNADLIETKQVMGEVVVHEYEAKKMFEHFDTEMPSDMLDNMWTNIEVGSTRDHVDHIANASTLYSYMTTNTAQTAVLDGMVDVINGVNGDYAGEQSRAFFSAMVNEPVIFNSMNLRYSGSVFEAKVKGIMLSSADREQLGQFFDQWDDSPGWLTDNTTLADRLEIVYHTDPDATLGDFLANVADPAVIDTILADAIDVSAFDYFNARTSTVNIAVLGPVDYISIYSFGAVTDTTSLAEHHLYGSSRLGVQQYADSIYRQSYNVNISLPRLDGISKPTPWYSNYYKDLIKPNQTEPWGQQYTGTNDTMRIVRRLGYKHYELTDHLGNVLATVLDRKTGHNGGSGYFDYYNPDLSSVQDYYPGGMRMPERHKEIGDTVYRMSYNGQRRDDDIAGAFNHNTALYWEYDPLLMRRWNEDPEPIAGISNYAVFGNNPIWYNDPLGNTPNTYDVDVKNKTTTLVDNKGGDETDYVNVKNVPLSDGSDKILGGYSYSVPVKKGLASGYPGEVFRGPGYEYTGVPASGIAIPVDDPITSFGPSLLRSAGKKVASKLFANIGELSDDVAGTFRFSSYSKETLDKPMKLARYYDNNSAFAKGRYMTKPGSISGNKFLDRMGLALRYKWNGMTKVAYWEVPAGTTIYKGKAAIQFPWIGGKPQYFIPDISNIKRVIR